MKRLTDEQIKEIIILYTKERKTPKEIGAQFGLFNNSITRILKKNGIDRNQQVKMTKEKINYIIDQYNLGISSEVIANILNINGSTVCRILKRNNIDIRPPTQNKRQYSIVENYFENIDTEEKAYFLGLLYADGNLSKRGNSIKISLQEKDQSILEKLSVAIYGFVKIQNDKRILNNELVNYPYLAIYSKKMHDDLSKLGCSVKKTFTIRFPVNLLEDRLLKHFIRGYFDGDGCLSNSDINRPKLDITSNIYFIAELKQYLESKLNINISKAGQSGETGNIQISAIEDLKKFLEFMYKDAVVYMDRKKQYFNDFLMIYDNKKKNKNFKINDISKYSSTYVPDFKGNKLTNNYIKTIDSELKKEIAEDLLLFYRKNGFPFVNLTDDELIKEFSILQRTNYNFEDNTPTIFNMTGLQAVKHFSPHFFEVKSGIDKRSSMVESFNDDEKLKKTILNRLNSNFSINGNMIRQGLTNSHIAFKASVFNIVIGKWIYNKFIKEKSIIYDYSMGFGNRLLAALSLQQELTYIGVDPFDKSVDSNKNIYDFYNKNIPGLSNKTIDLYCIGSEHFNEEKYNKKVDVAFSSPPYFLQEIYDNSSSQAYYDNSYQKFINVWWRQTVKNIDQLLKLDGVFIINVKDIVENFNLSADMINVAKEFNFHIFDKYNIRLSKNTQFKNKNDSHKYEPIFVLKRIP